VMLDGGMSMIGVGFDDSNNRIQNAVYKALTNPLLALDMTEATGALINVTGGPDLTLKESETIVNSIRKSLAENAKIIWGTSVSDNPKTPVGVMLVVTGIKQSVDDLFNDLLRAQAFKTGVTTKGRDPHGFGIDML